MNRKNFFKALGIVPLLDISAKSFGKANPFLTESCQTQKDAEGPYYKADAPIRAVIETTGTPLRIEGKVLKGDDCKTPLANVILDIWHCDDSGEYDLQGFKCRAVQTNISSRKIFELFKAISSIGDILISYTNGNRSNLIISYRH